MITLADFNDLVKNAEVIWANKRAEYPTIRSQLANIKSVDKYTSEHSEISTLPMARRRDDGGDATKAEPKQGYTKTFTQAEIALQCDITKQMRMFDKYDLITQRVRGNAYGLDWRYDWDVTSLLSYAWSTSYTNMDGETVTTSTPDGVTLIDASHTPNGTSDLWSNELSTTHAPIDEDTLEDLLELFNNFLDDGDGKPIHVMPTHIITSNHAPTKFEVQRILRSSQQSNSANNAINPHQGSLQHLVVPYLDYSVSGQSIARDATKKQYVFVASLKPDENGIIVEESQAPRFEPPEQVFESSTWQFLGTALYDFGLTRASFIAGTKGTGASV